MELQYALIPERVVNTASLSFFTFLCIALAHLFLVVQLYFLPFSGLLFILFFTALTNLRNKTRNSNCASKIFVISVPPVVSKFAPMLKKVASSDTTAV